MDAGLHGDWGDMSFVATGDRLPITVVVQRICFRQTKDNRLGRLRPGVVVQLRLLATGPLSRVRRRVGEQASEAKGHPAKYHTAWRTLQQRGNAGA